MIEDNINALSVVIEAAVGLAGFAGIVIVLSSGPESHKHVDRFRVRNLLSTSLAAGLIAFFAIGLSHADYARDTVWRLSSGLFFVVAVGLTVIAYLDRKRIPADETREISQFLWITLFGGTVVALVVELLNAIVALPIDAFLVFYFGLIWLLFVAAAQFVRTIFTRSVWRGTAGSG